MGEHLQAAGTPTKKVRVVYEFDNGAAQRKIGLIALSTDQTTEYDFARMLPSQGVMFYTSRVYVTNPITVENLRKMGPQLADAAARILPGVELGAVAYSCTSGTVALGHDEVERQIQKGQPGVVVVTPMNAALAAFRELGIARISLLTPYIDDVNQAMREYVEQRGVEVLNIGGFCLENDFDMACLPPTAIEAAALEVCDDAADAIFISCTAIRSAEVVDRLETQLGKPVLTSNQCMFWESLRRAGYERSVDGYGQLLREA